MAQKHRTLIESDRALKVVVEGADDGPWFRVFHAIVDGGHLKSMSVGELRVLMALCHQQRPKENGWIVFPSVTRIEQDTGLKERAIYDSLRKLEEKAMIRRYSQPGKKTEYRITSPPTPRQRAQPRKAVQSTPADRRRGGLQRSAGVDCSTVQPTPASPRQTLPDAVEQELSDKKAESELEKMEDRKKDALDHLGPDAIASLRAEAIAAANDFVRPRFEVSDHDSNAFLRSAMLLALERRLKATAGQ